MERKFPAEICKVEAPLTRRGNHFSAAKMRAAILQSPPSEIIALPV
jgi:hypothetical protein